MIKRGVYPSFPGKSRTLKKLLPPDVTAKQFDRALAAFSEAVGDNWVFADETDEGEKVYQQWCIHCHGEDNSGPGTLRLAWDSDEEVDHRYY